MTKPQQKREKGQKREETKKRVMFKRKWTTDEDNIHITFKAKDSTLSWREIIEQGNLKDRDEKSCSHRWKNYLRPGIVKGGFTPEEDDIIKKQMLPPRNSWKSMAEHHLPGRPTNAIKNRWNSHLKKGIENERRDRLSPEEHDALCLRQAEKVLFDDEASELSVQGCDPEPLMAELASVIRNDDPNETLIDDEASELSVRRYDPEPLMAEFASLIPNVDPNETLIHDFLSEAEIDALIANFTTCL